MAACRKDRHGMDNDDSGAGPRRPDAPPRTSEVLRAISAAAGERVSFREILVGLRHRAFGFAMLIFALPSCLPMPPGIPTLCGIALVIIAINLLAARRRLWLPGVIADKSIARKDLARIVERMTPTLERLERICRPRLAVATETIGKICIGAVVLVLGLVMILPIPLLGNMPPAAATVVIAIGVTERDGLIVIAGLVAAAAAIAIASAATVAAVVEVVRFFAS
jgi:hypothetical protein